MATQAPEPEVAAAPRRAWVETCMGIPMSIHVRGRAADAAEVSVTAAAVREAFATLHRVDRVFSTWNRDSDLLRCRRGELAEEDADPLLLFSRQLAEQANAATYGAFITKLPGPEGPTYDPTGLVKGWGADLAAPALADLDGSWCINVGGDLLIGGTPSGGPISWRIGLDHGDGVRRAVDLTSGAVATSGLAARGAHLIDPATLTPATNAGTVTVVGPTLLWADVWATAIAVGAPAHLLSHGCRVVES